MKTAKLLLEVDYDPAVTTDDAVAQALDKLLSTALSTAGLLDDIGHIEVGELFPIEEDPRKG